ncbi:MAG: hypothetical protein NTY09_01945 [bacterium]|nr:hypothetical protein [bacterium]
MTRRQVKSKFTFTTSISETPMTKTEWEACEDLLAKLVAKAIATDLPEFIKKEIHTNG